MQCLDEVRVAGLLGLSMDGPAAYLQALYHTVKLFAIVSRSFGIFGALLPVVVLACDPSAEEIQLSAPQGLAAELASHVPTFTDPAQLTFVSDALLRGDTLAVLDWNDCVVFFDAQLRYKSSAGRSGSGPGELLRPTSLAIWNGTWAIADNGNARLTWLTQDSAWHGHRLPAMRGRGLVVTSEGAAILPKRGDTHYAVRVAPDGTETAWAVRPWPPGQDATMHPTFTGFEKDHIAMLPGDTLIVVDGDSLVIRKYAPDGTYLEQRSLPRSLRVPLLRSSGSSADEFAGRRTVRYAPAVGTVSSTSDGLVVIGLPFREELNGAVAMVLDPASWNGFVLRGEPGEWAYSATKEFYVITADRDRVAIVAHDGRIGMYGLPRVRHDGANH